MDFATCTAHYGGILNATEVNILFEGKQSESLLNDDIFGPTADGFSSNAYDSLMHREKNRSSFNSQRDRSLSPNLLSPDECFSPRAEIYFRSVSEALPLSPGFSAIPDSCIDIKSGSLLLVDYINSNDCTSEVYVKVIGNSYEHHAQIYTDRDFTNQLGYISLRNCTVNLSSDDLKTIEIVLNAGQTKTKCFKFIAETEAEAVEWTRALVPKNDLDASSDCSPQSTPLLTRSNRCSPSPSEDH